MGLLVSIIVTNYNYDRFLAAAIDSALGQTYPGVEVIVVDDGSTDRSQAIIEGYGDRVIPVIKANGGMGSAFNAGFARSHGEIVLFLDSDDLLLPGTVEATVAMFRSAGVAKVHWPLWEIDAEGEWMDRVVPQGELGQGDFREVTISLGPDRYLSAPTSGNAWSRRFLESVLPVPEADFRQHADTYLYTLAPIFGTVRRLAEPGGCYRVHGRNDYACRPADEKHRRNLVVFDRRAAALEKYLAAKGIAASSDAWRGHNPYYIWLQRLQLAAQEIKAIVPEGERFILVDENQWADGSGGEVIGSRSAVPFLERDGLYWGPPPTDEVAIEELERMRQTGARFMVIGWPAFWWLEYYAGLRRHLRSRFLCLLENEHLLIFDLCS